MEPLGELMEPWARKQRCPKKMQFLVEIFLPWQVPIRQKSPGGPRWGPNSGGWKLVSGSMMSKYDNYIPPENERMSPEIRNHFKKENIAFSTIIFLNMLVFGGVIHLQSEHLPMQSLRKVPGPMGARFHGGEYSVLSVLFEDLVISGQIMVKFDEHHHQTYIMVYVHIYMYIFVFKIITFQIYLFTYTYMLTFTCIFFY